MRRFFIYTFTGLLLLFLGLSSWIYLNRDTLNKQAVQQLNKHLQAPVNIGDIRLTFQQWPSMAVSFTDVYAAGSFSTAPRDTLLYFETVQVTFDWWQALFQQFSVKGVYGLNGQVNLHENGSRSNYWLFKPDTSQSSPGPTLQGVFLKNTIFTLRAKHTKIFSTFIEKARAEGRFIDSLQLENSWLLKGATFYQKGNKHALTDLIKLQSTLKKEPLHLSISDGSLSLGKELQSTFLVEVIKNTVSVEFELKEQPLQTVIEQLSKSGLLPSQPLLSKAKGTLNMNGRYYTMGDEYNLETNMEITELQGSAPAQNHFQSGVVKAHLISGLKGDRLTLDSLHLNTSSGYLQGHGTLTDFFEKPLMNLSISSTLSLTEWLSLMQSKAAPYSSAQLRAQLRLKQQFKSLDDMQLQNISGDNLKGFLEVEKGTLRMGEGIGALEEMNGRLNFESQYLAIERLYAKKGNSDFYLTGRLKNLLPYLFKPGQPLIADAKFISQNINLKDFLTQKTQTSETDFLRYFSQLNLKLNLQIDALKFQNFKAQNISGTLRAADGFINLTEAQMALADGTLQGSLNLHAKTDSVVLQSNFNTENMVLPKLFAAFNNFDQSTLYSKHLQGKASVQTALKLRLSSNFHVDLSSLKAQSSFEINDGQLNQFEPMLALSRFAQMDQLKNVQFAKLQSGFTIKNETIHFIPTMIQSNVLDFVGAGTHNFDNQIDYKVRLKVREVLSKNDRSKNLAPELSEHLYEQETNDVPYLFLRLTGDALNPTVSIDKEAWLSSIGKDLKNQKKEWRQKLQQKNNPKDKGKGIEYEWDGF